MARGPRGEGRPEDPAAAAVMVARLATGEISEELDAAAAKKKDPEKVARGRLAGLKGAAARAKVLSADQKSQIARKAARSRWKDRNV